MKKLYSFIVLVSLTGINAWAQTNQPARTPQVKAKLGLVKPFLPGPFQLTEACDTFNNFCPDDELVLYMTAGGYVGGQNEYGDISKADIFKLPGTAIQGLLLFFGAGSAANSVDQFKVRIWDNDGSFADGSTGGPGTVLAETLVKYIDVESDVANGDMTYVEFNPLVAMPADSTFYAGINFGYNAGDTIGLNTTLDRSGLSCEGMITAVEEWDPNYYDGGWYTYASWGFSGVSNAIYPITCEGGCNIPGGLVTKDITATSVKFKWDPFSGATSYRLRYKEATTGSWTLLAPTGHTKTVENLLANTKYVWQVRSVCGTDPKITSDWSAKQFFTAAPFKLSDEDEASCIEVYPNPVSNTATISLSLIKGTHTVVELFDLTGRGLQTLLDKNLAAGNHEVIFNRRQLSPGLYLLQVKMGDQLDVKKLVVE
ncbi:MAG: T9SS type A sorting domain-containing protein [Chitinophagales bacterium]